MKTLLLAIVLIANTASAAVWESSYDRGLQQYRQDDGRWGLSIACSDIEPLSMTFRSGNKLFGSFADKPFSVTIDGKLYPVPYVTDTPDRAKAWESFYEALRVGKDVAVIFGANRWPVNQKDAEVTLPPIDSPEYQCTTQAKPGEAVDPTGVLPSDTFDVQYFQYSKSRWDGNHNQIILTSKIDDITIEALIVNRGRCSMYYQNSEQNMKFPTKLGFADKAAYQLTSIAQCDEVLEFTVVTDRGQIVYTRN